MANKYTKEDKVEYIDSPAPTMRELFEDIVRVISCIPSARYPKQLPSNSHDAANKFIGLIKFKPTMFEKPTKRDDSTIWVWPFRDRILILLNTYIWGDDLLRDTIDSAKEIGVDWRGDDFYELVNVINEHELMNKIGVHAYRKQTIQKMKKLNLKV